MPVPTSPRDAPNAELDIDQIRLDAQRQWMQPSTICKILCDRVKFPLASKPPCKPPSGSFFLYNRKKTPNFRNDGYTWSKNKNGKTRKESHSYGTVNGNRVLHGYYAYREENEHFHRRSYWMIEQDESHIALVHYLDEKNANDFSGHRQIEDTSYSEINGARVINIQASEHENAKAVHEHETNPEFRPPQELQYPTTLPAMKVDLVPHHGVPTSSGNQGQISSLYRMSLGSRMMTKQQNELLDHALTGVFGGEQEVGSHYFELEELQASSGDFLQVPNWIVGQNLDDNQSSGQNSSSQLLGLPSLHQAAKPNDVNHVELSTPVELQYSHIPELSRQGLKDDRQLHASNPSGNSLESYLNGNLSVEDRTNHFLLDGFNHLNSQASGYVNDPTMIPGSSVNREPVPHEVVDEIHIPTQVPLDNHSPPAPRQIFSIVDGSGSSTSEDAFLDTRLVKFLSLKLSTAQTSNQSSSAETSRMCREISTMLKVDSECRMRVEGRKQLERIDMDLAYVKSMVQCPEARNQYCRIRNVVSQIQKNRKASRGDSVNVLSWTADQNMDGNLNLGQDSIDQNNDLVPPPKSYRLESVGRKQMEEYGDSKMETSDETRDTGVAETGGASDDFDGFNDFPHIPHIPGVDFDFDLDVTKGVFDLDSFLPDVDTFPMLHNPVG